MKKPAQFWVKINTEVLRAIKGKFILSINDVQPIRDLFAWAQLTEVKTSYTISASADRAPTRAELLISNFPLGD